MDNEFPADQSSIGSDKECAWVRAPHLLTTPRLFSDNLEPNDIMQGALGDCWLMVTTTTTTIAPLPPSCHAIAARSRHRSDACYPPPPATAATPPPRRRPPQTAIAGLAEFPRAVEVRSRYSVWYSLCCTVLRSGLSLRIVKVSTLVPILYAFAHPPHPTLPHP